MKVLLILLFLPLFSKAQRTIVQKAQSFFYSVPGNDTLYVVNGLAITESDTVKSLLLVSDTLQIGGKINNKVVWIKGYKVLADYETYYLDISKQRLPKNIIIWLDQNE